MATAWIFLIAIGSCSRELPSEVPLGVGPNPGKDDYAALDDGGPKEAAAETGTSAVASTATAAPPEVPPPPETPKGEPDAGQVATAAEDAGAAPDAGAKIVYAGQYAGSDTSVFRFAHSPEPKTENDPNAKTRVVENADGSLAITFVSSSDGSDICTLQAKPKGRDAVIAAGQACFSGGRVSGKVTSGKARFDGKRLVIDLTADLELNMGGQTLTGSLQYHFDGARP